VILAQLATPTLKKAQYSEFFVVFYNWSQCSLNWNINGSLAVFTQPVTAPLEKGQKVSFLRLLQPVIMFLKHTPRPPVPYRHLSITYHHVPEACTLLYSPWTKVHTALTMFNGSLGAFHN